MTEEFKKILEEWGTETVAKMIAVLESERKVATATLRDSIQYELTDDGIKFIRDDVYGKFVESGTRGHYISVKNNPGVATKFKEWANARGLTKQAANYGKLERKGGGYIKVATQRPVPYFKQVILDEIDNLSPKLEEGIVQYLEDRIKILNENNNL